MRDFPLNNVSPFPAKRDANGHAAVHIAPIGAGFVFHVLGNAQADEASLKKLIHDIAPDVGGDLRSPSPGQWFWIGACEVSQDRQGEILAKLPGDFAISDQTHGRVRLSVSGGKVRDVLAKGTMIDLGPDVFAVGASAMTQIGHIGAMITRTDEDCFEIMVLRSFAVSLWDELHHMAAEFE
ncbi:MAG: sarcosine oxidase subunit gamma family protein [Thalassospira sp.]|uniref:sarcosine oxidase subunit gamma n=1 Tax=Thalassospira sp. TaxID=1912094 RepID=UPI0032EDDB6E